MKLKFRGNIGIGKKSVHRVCGMDVVMGEVYDIPDTVGEFLVRTSPNEWKAVEYNGKSKEPANMDYGFMEKVTGVPVCNFEKKQPENPPKRKIEDRKDKMLAGDRTKNKRGKK